MKLKKKSRFNHNILSAFSRYISKCDFCESSDRQTLHIQSHLTIPMFDFYKNNKDYYIPLNKFAHLNLIFNSKNQIFKAIMNNKPVIIKKIPVFSYFKHEFEMMFVLQNHKHIIQLYGYSYDIKNKYYYIIMEYCRNGDLFKYLDTKYNQHFFKWSLQILDAMQWMHKNGIIHCDLKPENIGITKTQNIKILDFEYTDYENIKTRIEGTLGYTDIDICIGNNKWSYFSDIYSYGIILFTLFSKDNSIPFGNNVDNYDIYERLSNGENIDTTQVINPSIKKIIENCIRMPPGKRWNLSKIKDELLKIEKKQPLMS